MMERPIKACSFDFGQTIATLDVEFLREKLVPFGLVADAESLDRGLPHAWHAYDLVVRAGVSGHPWKVFMRALLERAIADAAPDQRETAVDYLWDDQPKRNLWRRPLTDVVELIRELRDLSIPYGVLSNSEGKLAELIDEMQLRDLLPLVGDSGRLGMEKPDPRMFQWMADKLGTPLDQVVHIGDSLGADVLGALKAGMRAIWFRPAVIGRGTDAAPDGVTVCTDATELRAELERLGVFRRE